MENKKVNIPKISSSAEDVLIVIANITLALGFIAAAIVLLNTSKYSDAFTPIVIACGILVSSVLSCSVLKVIANISLRLKGIQETMLRRPMTESENRLESAKQDKLKQTALEREEYESHIKKQSQLIQEEYVEEFSTLNTEFKVGDTIVYKGKQYDIKNINNETGELCIKKGISSFIWIKPEDLLDTKA